MVEKFGVDSSSSEYGTVAGSSEHGNEISGLVKVWEILQ
jgi:hypothetical protein